MIGLLGLFVVAVVFGFSRIIVLSVAMITRAALVL
jgi:hypothetical protein